MGGGESGVSQGAQVITRLSLHLFVGGGWGTEYNKVENFWTWNSSPSCKWKFPPNMTFGTFGETSYKKIIFISLLIIDDVSKFIITKQEWRAVTLKINFLI